jgi:hypothetical protein
MSNIVVDAESQTPAAEVIHQEPITNESVEQQVSSIDQLSEVSEVSDIEIEDTTSSIIPDKFAGKSVEDIVDSYTNLEKELGRKAQEVGELRKLSDSFLQAEVTRNQNNPQQTSSQETQEEDRMGDFFEDPNKAVNQMIEDHPKFQEFQEFQAQQAQASSKIQLEQTHPDFTDVIQDNKFQEWVQGSPIRMQLFQAADAYNFDAANELLNNWKDRSMVSKTQAVNQAAEEDRQTKLKAATTESRSASGSKGNGKSYRRADLIRLKMEDPNRYESLQDEIFAAYSDGRVT